MDFFVVQLLLAAFQAFLVSLIYKIKWRNPKLKEFLNKMVLPNIMKYIKEDQEQQEPSSREINQEAQEEDLEGSKSNQYQEEKSSENLAGSQEEPQG